MKPQMLVGRKRGCHIATIVCTFGFKIHGCSCKLHEFLVKIIVGNRSMFLGSSVQSSKDDFEKATGVAKVEGDGAASMSGIGDRPAYLIR
jgi:hypothetical protein